MAGVNPVENDERSMGQAMQAFEIASTVYGMKGGDTAMSRRLKKTSAAVSYGGRINDSKSDYSRTV